MQKVLDTTRKIKVFGSLTAFEKEKIRVIINGYDDTKNQRKQLRNWGIAAPINNRSKKKVTLLKLGDEIGEVQIESWKTGEWEEFPRWHIEKTIEFKFKL